MGLYINSIYQAIAFYASSRYSRQQYTVILTTMNSYVACSDGCALTLHNSMMVMTNRAKTNSQISGPKRIRNFLLTVRPPLQPLRFFKAFDTL